MRQFIDLNCNKMTTKKHPSLLTALLPVFFLLILLSLNVYFFEDDTLSGANQMALLLAAGLAGIISIRLNVSWGTISKSIVKSIGSAMTSILILLMIGSLAGTWMMSGIVPAMIYYGLQILNPEIFLFAAVCISAVVSVATGSSWSTIATIGVALLGIGQALNIHEGIVAGAIISGAYFGDKMSPLSDTTNLAPTMAGAELFTHIRYMMQTTLPSIILTLIAFLIIGLTYDFGTQDTHTEQALAAIRSTFYISPVLFIVPAILIFMIIKKVHALPALLSAALLGGICAIIFQPDIIRQIAQSDNYAEASYISVMKAMYGEVAVTTGYDRVNDLLGTSGMSGMLDTIWLILAAMVFGGTMEAGGFLIRITEAVISKVHSTGSLVLSTATTCLFFNFTASDQYISLVVPGRMFAKTYRQRGYKPELLSRTLEDSGTVTSVLIPWNTCGATQAKVLGVATLSYLPYAFFNLISPLMTIAFAYLNIRIRRYKSEEECSGLKKQKPPIFPKRLKIKGKRNHP